MMSVSIPKDRQVYEGEIATYWMEDGILISLSKNPRRTVENITANMQLVKRITGNKTVPLLIYLSASPIPDKATRKFVNQQLANLYKAMAMVSKPGLASFIMSFLFRFKPPPIPMKNFTDAKEAKAWLKQFL
jgi:hypothetical protein